MWANPDEVARQLAVQAPALGELREAYIAAGFHRHEALELCMQAQAITLTPPPQDHDADPSSSRS